MLKVLDKISLGDLVAVDWCDASCGKSSLNGGSIDVPVRSWGLYLGLMGKKIKQVVLAQNSFRFSGSLYDIDYTAVPISWVTEVQCVQVNHVPLAVVNDLLRSFVSDSKRSTCKLKSVRIFHHKVQRKLSVNGGPN